MVHICERVIIQCTPQGFCQVRWDHVCSVAAQHGLWLRARTQERLVSLFMVTVVWLLGFWIMLLLLSLLAQFPLGPFYYLLLCIRCLCRAKENRHCWQTGRVPQSRGNQQIHLSPFLGDRALLSRDIRGEKKTPPNVSLPRLRRLLWWHPSAHTEELSLIFCFREASLTGDLILLRNRHQLELCCDCISNPSAGEKGARIRRSEQNIESEITKNGLLKG